MPKFEGCVQAKEISLCPKSLGGGANPHAHVLVLKTLGGNAADPKPENTPMLTEAEKKAAADKEAAAARAAEINKAARGVANKIAGMSDVTKAYYLALDDAAQDVFLAKSAEEMKTEAETAKAAADKKVAEEEAAKAGKTVEVVALEKKLGEQGKLIEELQAKDADREIEKRAETEFDGFPGGAKAVVPLLKAYATLSPEARKASEDVLKAQAATAKAMSKAFGARSEQDVSKAEAANANIEKAVKALMDADKSLTRADAWEQVIERQEFADDVAALNG